MFTMVRASEMFPKPQLVRDPGCRSDLDIPFFELPGEGVMFLGEIADGDGTIAMSNYRLHISRSKGNFPNFDQMNSATSNSINIPLTCIEYVEQRDLFFMNIYCKDGRFYLVQFSDNATCKDWINRITVATSPPTSMDQVFAFAHSAWCRESNGEDSIESFRNGELTNDVSTSSFWFRNDVARLRFDLASVWRISQVNKDFKMCASYPPELLVPASISDQVLETVAKFRLAGRIPTIVWRHVGNGAVLARCSQPAVGWLGWRSSEDEELVNAISEACAFDAQQIGSDEIDGINVDCDQGINRTSESDGSLKDFTADVSTLRNGGELKKVLIIDARSYFVGIGNRTRGGGVEYPEYYPNSEIQFMGLSNIHDIRKSFQRLRAICSQTPVDQTIWLQSLDSTKWLHHLSGLIRAASLCAKALHVDARPVMVHCSDGWDRTPQIVALTELLVDPYYRSMDGFRALVEKEWLDFGHKMSDRNGVAFTTSDPNERCPIFLQFLDCVHQLLLQFPCDFEFNISYLFKLAQHTYSSLFGTFLCNSLYERRKNRIGEQTRSVWDFLSSKPFNFCNLLYRQRNEVLWPKYEVRDLLLWQDVYLSEQSRGINVGYNPSNEMSLSNGKKSGCVSSSDSGANSSRDGSESGELQSQDICLVKQQLELLQVGASDDVEQPAGDERASKVAEAAKSSERGQVCGCANNEDLVAMARKKIDASTDTLVPEGETDERLRERSSTLVAHDAPALCVGDEDSKSVLPINGGKVVACSKPECSSSGQPPSKRPKLDFSGGPLRIARPWEVPVAAQERADAFFRNQFDSDGLPVHQTEVQRRLVAIYFTHQEQVMSLQRDLHLTRMALCKQKVSGACKCSAKPTDEDFVMTQMRCSDASSASETSSTWENVDERETKPTLWVPDHASVECMCCQTNFWFGRRKHHCRSCGNLVCAECSSNSLPLPDEQLYHPVRVCDNCFRKLQPEEVSPKVESPAGLEEDEPPKCEET